MTDKRFLGTIVSVILASLAVTGVVAALALLPQNGNLPVTSASMEALYLAKRGNRLAGRLAFTRAISEYGQAIEMAPALRAPYINAGLSYLKLRRPKEALEVFERASAVWPLDAGAITGMGESYFAMEQYADAAEEFKKAMDMDPTYWPARRGFGWSKVNQDLPEEAIPAFEGLVKLRPALPDGYLGLGEAYFIQQANKKAEAMYLRAIALRRELPLAHSQLGWLTLASAEAAVSPDEAEDLYTLAEKHFIEALSYDPYFALAHEGLEASGDR